jgi:hypothetical protein
MCLGVFVAYFILLLYGVDSRFRTQDSRLKIKDSRFKIESTPKNMFFATKAQRH